MLDPEVKKNLERLRTEIEKSPQSDRQRQQLLNELKADIEKSIDTPPSEHHQSLRDRLKEAVVHFEAEHPTLGQAMEIAAHSLSSIGI